MNRSDALKTYKGATILLYGHKLWPTSNHSHSIPLAPFPAMLVCLHYSHTPWCHPTPHHFCCQFEIAYQLILQSWQSPVSTSGNLTQLLPPPPPFCRLAATANIMFSLPLQLTKVIVLAEGICFYLYLLKLREYLQTLSQVGVALFSP